MSELKSKYHLLDHRRSINKLYEAVTVNENITAYKLLDELFSIKNASKKKIIRKRSHDSDDLQDETLAVQQMYQEFLLDIPTELKARISKESSHAETSEVRNLARKLFESTVFDLSGVSGGNTAEEPLKCVVKDESFLIPAKSRFHCGCVKEHCKRLAGSKFDILIADPPWWNKFIRRLKNANEKLSYSMMYNEDIASIPVRDLLAPECLVAVWCTNAPSNIDAVKNIIFPQWGVTYLTTWYWLKVTVELEPLCPFSCGARKQPYERLLLGRVGDVHVPEGQLVVSVPSALHSHKPPLLDLLSPHLQTATPQTLELFARYLLPHTTSVGFEPLKWQHLSLYEEVQLDNKHSMNIAGQSTPHQHSSVVGLQDNEDVSILQERHNLICGELTFN